MYVLHAIYPMLLKIIPTACKPSNVKHKQRYVDVAPFDLLFVVSALDVNFATIQKQLYHKIDEGRKKYVVKSPTKPIQVLIIFK